MVNLPIEHGDARTIVIAIKNFLVEKGIPLHKMVGLASDGASVMMGSRSGVGKRLRDGWAEDDDDDDVAPLAPHLVHIHCVAHRYENEL